MYVVFVMKNKGKKGKRKRKKEKILVQGDDAIETFEADWLDFRTPAIELAKQLRMISESSGVCCGILGPWGCGKSSFMKLMDEYIRKESSWKNVHIAWFTAWDPAGIQDLGDAMLYHFFRDVAGKNKEMASALKELQQALGIRRSFRERAGQALKDVSGTLPTAGRAAATVASGLLREFDAPRKVQASFEKLMKWLEKEKRTVFFFIDDIDRATGEQIRDLLSELKLYVSNRRIIALLAYDENYVLNALKDVLPPKTDAKKYLEKIVTMRRNVPIPSLEDLMNHADRLISSMLDLPVPSERLGYLAATLSSVNPRRLKTIVLSFAQFVASSGISLSDHGRLETSLVIVAANNLSFLTDEGISYAMESGGKERIISSIQEFVKKNPAKSKEAEVLLEAIREVSPEFVSGLVSTLKLSPEIFPIIFLPSLVWKESTSTDKVLGFDWSSSLFPILSNATMHGFKITSDIARFSKEVTIPPSTENRELVLVNEEPFKKAKRILRHSEIGCALSWNGSNMVVLLTSSVGRLDLMRDVTRRFVNGCPSLAAKQCFILWLIDDRGLLGKTDCEHLIVEAQELSEGLKHAFVFMYTPASKVSALLEFLLGIVSKQG